MRCHRIVLSCGVQPFRLCFSRFSSLLLQTFSRIFPSFCIWCYKRSSTIHPPGFECFACITPCTPSPRCGLVGTWARSIHANFSTVPEPGDAPLASGPGCPCWLCDDHLIPAVLRGCRMSHTFSPRDGLAQRVEPGHIHAELLHPPSGHQTLLMRCGRPASSKFTVRLLRRARTFRCPHPGCRARHCMCFAGSARELCRIFGKGARWGSSEISSRGARLARTAST